MKDEDIAVLNKIIKYCDDVKELLNEYDNNYDSYCNKISFQYSVNMCIIQIGELVGRLSDEFIEEYSETPWYAIKAMRNLHAHDYERVDYEIMWNTITKEIPELKSKLEEILYE